MCNRRRGPVRGKANRNLTLRSSGRAPGYRCPPLNSNVRRLSTRHSMRQLLVYAVATFSVLAMVAFLRGRSSSRAAATTRTWLGSVLRILVGAVVFLALMYPSRNLRFVVTAILALGVALAARLCLAALPPPELSSCARLSKVILSASYLALTLGIMGTAGMWLILATDQ